MISGFRVFLHLGCSGTVVPIMPALDNTINYAYAPPLLGSQKSIAESSQTIVAPGAIGCEVSIAVVGPDTRSWYTLSDTFSLGWVSEVYEDGSNGELHFINFLRTRILFRQI